MKLKKNQLWKSLPANMAPHGHRFELNKWYKVKGKLEICKNGFHGSKRVIDAMNYVDLEILALCEVRGKSQKEDDKECWQEIKLVKAWKWGKKDSVELAVFAAEQVIDIYEKQYPNDDRPRKAIKSAKNWLRNPTEKSSTAAWDAAGAARDAAWAAGAAAWDAAWAAGAAAWAAAWAARDAGAAAKVLDKCEDFIQKKIEKLEPYV